MASLALALQETNLAGDEINCKSHGSRHSPMHWEKTDSKLWANSIGSRPTTASSYCCQCSRPWTPASSSTASSRPHTATYSQGVVEDAQASAEAARAEADAALAAAIALDVLPAGLPMETPNISCGTRHDEIGNLPGIYAHACPASIIRLGPVLPTLTAAAVSDFLGSLSRSRAVFDKLDWAPQMPFVEKPVDSNCPLSGEAYSDNSLGSRCPLQRVNVARFEQRPSELMVGAGSARASNLSVNCPASQIEDSGTTALESGASPSSRKVSRAPTRRRSISRSSDISEAGAGNNAETGRGRLHRPADVRSNSEKLLLPRVQSGVTTPTVERSDLFDSACRRNDADYRPHQRRGLLMRAAAHVEGPRNGRAVLPPLPKDTIGHCRSAASLQQQPNCSGDNSRLQRSQSLVSSSLLPRALNRGPSSSQPSSHGYLAAASRGRVQIDHVRTKL